jgi:N-acetylmuramoyl-L-alanine amidase
MRADDFLEEGKWKNIIGPAAYLAVNAGAYGLSKSGHGGEPAWATDGYAQVADTDSESLGPDDGLGDSATIKLNDPRPAKAEPAPREQQADAQTKDARLLALTIWGEARGEGEDGMRAVGHVIKNRMKSDRFGDDVASVVWKRKAFSCWNPHDPNRNKMRELAKLPKNSIEYKRWKLAKKIAAEILSNRSHDPTHGALFYHTKNIKPGWADSAKAVAKVANHIFYRIDRKARDA